MGNSVGGITPQRYDLSDVDGCSLSKEHLKCYEEKIKSMDASMTSLAYSLDVMHAAVMKEYKKSKTASSTENVGPDEMDDLTLKLLFKIERTILHDQECAVNSLRDFLHFSWECITLIIKPEFNDSREFSLDRYVSIPKESRKNRPEIEMGAEEAIVENARLKEDIEMYYKREKKFDMEKQIVSEKIKKLETLNDSLRSQKEEKNRNITELMSQLRNLKSDLESKERALTSIQLKLEEAQNSKSRLVSLSTENEEIKCLNEQVKKDLENTKEEKKCFETELEGRKRDLKTLQTQFKDEKVERHRLLTENEDMNRKNKRIRKTLEETVKEQKLLQQALEKGNYEIKRLGNAIDESSIRTQKLEKERDDLGGQLSTACHKNLKIEERMNKTIRLLEQSNERLQEENNSLKQELELLKIKKISQVQVYCQNRSGLIAAIEEELTCLLKSKLEANGKVEIEFTKRLQAADVNPNTPLLLLCISASRIETDAENTIQGLNLTSKMWLLIFHHKDVHAVPSQASYQVLTGKEYAALGGICDLAFLTGKGLFSCPMNESSIDKIVNFIDTSVRSSDENN